MDAIAPARRAGLGQTQILAALRALRRGQFGYRMPGDLTGIEREIAETFNDVMELSDGLARELARMRRVVGREGCFAERAKLAGAAGCWQDCIDSVNELVQEVVQPTTEVARVLGAVAKGDLSQTMDTTVDGRPLKGEFLRIARTANTMVERLALVASEATRVAREVGIEDNPGGQAQVAGVTGTGRDHTDNVNAMAGNLTDQVRTVAEVTTAVATGDLSKKITADVKGEIPLDVGTEAPNAGKKVLVVDDDHEVRAVAVALLRDLGYIVVEASDGAAGLAMLKSDPSVALLFTDWAMPGMDGRQLAARATEIRPRLPVLFTSGNANEFLAASDVVKDARFLAKPYRQHDLAAAVDAALAGGGNGPPGSPNMEMPHSFHGKCPFHR